MAFVGLGWVGLGWAGRGRAGRVINKHVVNTQPGEARAFALVLITLSASSCVTCEGLQGRVMEVYWNNPLNSKRKERNSNSDHCDLEIGIRVEKFLFLLLPLL